MQCLYGFFLKRYDGTFIALKGVCTHMECNISYQPDSRRFYCACHKGWFDDRGKNIEGPPPLPLEKFDIVESGQRLLIAKKGAKIDLSKV